MAAEMLLALWTGCAAAALVTNLAMHRYVTPYLMEHPNGLQWDDVEEHG